MMDKLAGSAPKINSFTWVLGAALILLAGCSTNPATGEQQFTALMPVSQEAQVGAQEHEKIVQLYGVIDDAALAAYVATIGGRVAAPTERPEVTYRFTVLDSPMVNAFALPGGYVYVTRGLLAQANSEAELAAVLAHEIGHVTGRHGAARYSQGALAQIGQIALAAATDNPYALQAAGLGSALYLKSYSREQEHEADDLGIRYLVRAGYSPDAMASFLYSLGANSALEAQISGKGSGPGFDLFSTHPLTEKRVARARSVASQAPQQEYITGRAPYLDAIDGMVYGDSRAHGFAIDQTFWHPEIGFTFTAPDDFVINNQPTQIVAAARGGSGDFVFDLAARPQGLDPAAYVQNVWLKETPQGGIERIEINGMPAATASFQGTVSGRRADIRVVAVQWSESRFMRFQMAIPQGASPQLVEEMKRTTYSLRRMTAEEKRTVTPLQLDIVQAGAGDTLKSLAGRMAFENFKEERFRVLNGITGNEGIVAGKRYKIVTR